jgi:hypothetical protein
MRSTLLVTVLAALGVSGCTTADGGWQATSVCIDVAEDAMTCPAASRVDLGSTFHTEWCDADVKSLDGEGTLGANPWGIDSGTDDLICCYPATAKNTEPNCVIGRPFLRDGQALTSTARPGDSWRSTEAEAGPDSPALAAAWLQAALGEHASVAAFARVTLEVMALGAPADLVAGLQRAALDEVAHAQLCFDMVARFGGGAVEPGPFPLPATLSLATTPVDIAVAAVREGCIGETVSAWLAERAAERATDPQARQVLDRIAADEARHAALSWRLVAWLLEEHGADVYDAVVAALAEPVEVAPMLVGDASLAAFGAIAPHEHIALIERARAEVLVPAAQALLAA